MLRTRHQLGELAKLPSKHQLQTLVLQDNVFVQRGDTVHRGLSYRTLCLCKGWGTPFTGLSYRTMCAKGGGHHSQRFVLQDNVFVQRVGDTIHRFVLQDNVCKGWRTPFTEVCPTGQCVCAKGGGTPFTEVCPTGHCVCAKGGGHHSQRFASKLDASLSPRPKTNPSADWFQYRKRHTRRMRSGDETSCTRTTTLSRGCFLS